MASIGTITQYERFDNLQHTYTNAAGVAIDISGWSVEAQCKSPSGTITEVSGTVTDGPTGVVSVPWDATWSGTPGGWRLEIWVRNVAESRLHSSDPITWTVRAAVGQPFV